VSTTTSACGSKEGASPRFLKPSTSCWATFIACLRHDISIRANNWYRYPDPRSTPSAWDLGHLSLCASGTELILPATCVRASGTHPHLPTSGRYGAPTTNPPKPTTGLDGAPAEVLDGVEFDVTARAHCSSPKQVAGYQLPVTGKPSRVSGRESRQSKAKEVDPLPPGLHVYFQQLREGATSKYLILQLVTRKYLKTLVVTSYQLRQNKRDGVLLNSVPISRIASCVG
jgi:hypothetical protein